MKAVLVGAGIILFGAAIMVPGAAAAPTSAEPVVAAPDATVATEADGGLLPGALTVGVRGGDDVVEGQLDLLIPLYRCGSGGLLLLNPRTSHNDDAERELNLGIAYRQLAADDRLLFGGNLYYDSRWPRAGVQFNQLGAGIEFMSAWLDARANYYLPEDSNELIAREEATYHTSHTEQAQYLYHGATSHSIYEVTRTTIVDTFLHELTEIYETPLEGYDAEIGLRIPMPWDWVETRLFGGYYHFEPNLGNATIEGYKGRLEIRALPALIFDAEVFEDDRLFGVDYLVGMRLQLPFDIGNLVAGRNPFEGARETFRRRPRGMRDRLIENVIRDPHIQIRTQDLVTQTSETLTAIRQDRATVEREVIFVNKDNVSGVEDGTFEFPFDTIQEGVNAVNSGRLVFVFDANRGPYMENVVVEKSMRLVGEGNPIGRGRGFGSGNHPEVVGQVGAPTFLVRGAKGADTVLVGGFDITQAARAKEPDVQLRAAQEEPAGGLLGLLVDGLEAAAFANSGILAANTTTFVSQFNHIHDVGFGVTHWQRNNADFSTLVRNTAIERTAVGIGSATVNSSGELVMLNNAIGGSAVGMLGAAVSPNGAPGAVNITAQGNAITGGGLGTLVGALPGLGVLEGLGDANGFGVVGAAFAAIGANASLNLNFTGNAVLNEVLGVVVAEALGANVNARLAENLIAGSGLGITLLAIEGSSLNYQLLDNTIIGGGLGQLLTPDLAMDDYGLAGILGVSLALGKTTSTLAGDIVGNTIDNNLLGITQISLGPNASNTSYIAANTVTGDGVPQLVIGILDLLAGIFDGDVGLPDDMVIPGFGLSGVTALAGLGASLDTTLERNRIVGHVAGLVGVEFLGADMTVSARNNDFIANGIGVGLCALNGDTLDAKIDNNRFRGAGSGELVSGLTGENAPAFDLAAVVAFGMDEDALDTTRLTLAMNGNTVDNYLVGGAFLSYGVGSYVNADVYDNTFNGAGLGAISTFATPADVTDFIDDHDDVKKFFDTPGAPDIHAAIAANQGGVGLIFGGFGSGLGRVSGDVQRNVIRNYYAPAVVFVEGRGIADPVAIANNTGTANTGWTYIDDFGFIGLTALANTFPMTLYDP